MTDAYVQEKLTAAFLTLNDATGKPYITFDQNNYPTNIAFPNRAFIPPETKQFFVLSFLPGGPEAAGLGVYAENRWYGLFQIDVYTPLGKGEDEVNAKYAALMNLFERGKCFDEIVIEKTYCPMRETDVDAYRAVIRIEWVADLEK
jgi:hypothetical protein